MWWSMYWPAPWVVFASVVLILFPAICVAIMFVARRGLSHLSLASCGAGLAPGKRRNGGIDDDASRRLPVAGRSDQVELDRFMERKSGTAPSAESRPQA